MLGNDAVNPTGVEELVGEPVRFHPSRPNISIVICTRNRAEDLRCTLDSVCGAEIPEGWRVTLFVVDNGSTDKTPEVVRAASPSAMRVRYAHVPVPGKSHALNHALRIADGDVLLFTDDDVRIPKHWLRGMCEPILNGEADAVAGGVVLAPHLRRPWMESWNTGILADTRRLDPEHPSQLVGANMAISSHATKAIGGFDTGLGPGVTGFGEETLYASHLKRLGFRIRGRLDIAVEHHLAADRLARSSYLRSLRLMGKTQAHLLHHWKVPPRGTLRTLASLIRDALALASLRVVRHRECSSPEGVPRWEYELVPRVYRSAYYLRLIGSPRARARAPSYAGTNDPPPIDHMHVLPPSPMPPARIAMRWLPSFLRREAGVRVLPCRDAFPRAEWERVREGYQVPTPEAPTLPMWGPAAREVQGPALSFPPLATATVLGGLFCPTNHALLNPDRTAVAESLGTARPRYPFRSDAVLETDLVVPLPGMATSLRTYRWNYYHMLVDCLPRLALLSESGRVREEVQVLYAGPESAPPERLVVKALGLSQPQLVRVEPGRLYATERYLLLPPVSRQFAGYLPRWYLDWFRSLVRPARPSRRDRRLYVSRSGVAKRRVLNEADLLETLRPLGFEVVALEALSFEEQAALFYDAESVVAPHGAGLTNLLFAEGARVLELFPTPYVVPHFYYLCKANGLPYHPLVGREGSRDDDFTVEVARVQEWLASSGIR
jgi:GT2 family glycosyltransferase